jgi:Rieske Fe-S protein
VNREIDRRRFVELGACAAAGATLLPIAGCASLATVRLRPSDGVLTLAVRNYPELDRPGGRLKVAAEGSAQPILVFSDDEAGFIALSSECTHLKCTVDLEGERVVCPCHGSTFDRRGQVLVGPAERPLDRYQTRLTNSGELEIRL